MNQTKVSTEALQLLTGDEAFHYRLVPYEVDPDANLYCFSDKEQDYDAIIHEIAIVYGFVVRPWPIPSDELTQMLGTYYRQSEPDEVSGLNPDLDFVAKLIEEAYRLRASDIHIEPSEHKCRVRFRIDGRLIERHIIKQSEYLSLIHI